MNLEEATQERFAALIGRSFRVNATAAPLHLALIQVQALGGRKVLLDQRQPFALVFCGPYEPLLRQRIYRLEYGDASALEIFLVPTGPDALGQRYEAIFS